MLSSILAVSEAAKPPPASTNFTMASSLELYFTKSMAAFRLASSFQHFLEIYQPEEKPDRMVPGSFSLSV